MSCECDHADDIALMKKTLFGNGDPQNSIVTQTALINKRVVRIERIGWAIIAGIMVTFGKAILTAVPIGAATTPAIGMTDMPAIVAQRSE